MCSYDLSFLYKAIQPRKENRFADAKEMLQQLQQIGAENLLQLSKEKVDVTEEDETDALDFVSYLNSLYSQSKTGNSGTRARLNGSKYDNETYVDTRLDKHLLPAILDGTYKLVIITGNAGDGKTAFIRKIEQKAKNVNHFEHKNGASFTINGTQYLSNYDGSQDEVNKLNNNVLNEFFNPFEGLSNFNLASEGRIIAINEGRLVEFLQTTDRHKHLKDADRKSVV